MKLRKDNLVEFSITESVINLLTKKIEKLEKRMKEIVDNEPNLKRLFDLVTSVKGIGPQSAYILLITTQAFTKFKTARQYASYAGVAPFPHQSGSSIKGRTKVSHLANKTVKAILSSAAQAAVRNDSELKIFFQRKIAQGKHRALVINIIKNKLLARVWAVVNRGTPFVNLGKFAQ